MPRVTVRLFGPPLVTVDGQPAPLRNRGELLLARLVLEGEQPIQRDALAAWAWPAAPRDRALHSLREALFRLRATLGDEGEDEPLLVVDRTSVALRRDQRLACDLLDFLSYDAQVRRHVHRRVSACDPCLAALRQLVDTRRGPLLDGVDTDLGEEVAAWVDGWRDRLDEPLAGALAALGDAALSDGRWDEAIQLAHSQLQARPWAEDAHRRLMRAHAGAGRPAQAVAHYESFAAHLESALGAAPEDATEELCERLRHGEPLDDAAPRAELAVPARPNAFFGREAELTWLAGRFSEPDVRWVTLVGPGGVGKTRLALEAAGRLGARFRDGACFVPLSGLKSPDELPAAAATALGIQLGNVAPTRVIAEWLRARELLLILDELEGLHGAVPTLRGWLDRAPNLRILATSQERVGLYAEHTLPVVGLDVPPPLIPGRRRPFACGPRACASTTPSAPWTRPRPKAPPRSSVWWTACHLPSSWPPSPRPRRGRRRPG